ncbi:MAG: T9SS type A sorting domain-containing protein [Candidatus Marinimicrobia bacterium]|nr:T9SS type A sorting domain-containing protein [Candidatus Neomarinimicrobiota bacterium]
MTYGTTLRTGDLNGDGVDDLIIGEQTPTVDSSVIHIFYGGVVFDTLVDVRIINRDNRWLDTGDITGDGIDDLVLWDRVTETHAVFYGGAGFDNVPDDHFDFDAKSVSIGHFDRDGIKDVVMGNSFSNRVRVYRGGFPIDKTPDWETREGDFLSAYGGNVTAVGDFNGDGADDFLVREIFGGPSDNSEGQVYLYLGDSAFVISAEPDKPILPTSYLTLQAYPNPFNASTTIKYSIPSKSLVRLDIYNIRGELIETLTDRVHEAGEYSVTFDGSRLSSGIYFMSLNSLREREVTKILLLK